MCIADDGKGIPELEYAKSCIETNTIGAVKLTKALLPLFSEDCRIVNVSSVMGALNKHSK